MALQATRLPPPGRIETDERRCATGFFFQTLNLVVQHVDFPLQLGLAAGVNQGLAALQLQFGDLGTQSIAFDVERPESPRCATVNGRRVLPCRFRRSALGFGALQPDLKLASGPACVSLLQSCLSHLDVVLTEHVS